MGTSNSGTDHRREKRRSEQQVPESQNEKDEMKTPSNEWSLRESSDIAKGEKLAETTTEGTSLVYGTTRIVLPHPLLHSQSLMV